MSIKKDNWKDNRNAGQYPKYDCCLRLIVDTASSAARTNIAPSCSACCVVPGACMRLMCVYLWWKLDTSTKSHALIEIHEFRFTSLPAFQGGKIQQSRGVRGVGRAGTCTAISGQRVSRSRIPLDSPLPSFELSVPSSNCFSQKHQLTMGTDSKGAELAGDITFIETPPAKPSQFETGEDCGISLTKVRLVAFVLLSGFNIANLLTGCSYQQPPIGS